MNDNATRPTGRPIRIVVADDHEFTRVGIKAVLRSLPHAEVVGEAGDGQELMRQVAEHAPDVVITDISMPLLDGIDAVREIRERWPDTSILVLSMHDSVERVKQAVAAGAGGYLMKNCISSEVNIAVEALAQGRGYFSSLVAQKLLEPEPPGVADELTERQVEVLTLIAEGKSSKEIAIELGISPKTVDVHRSRIMERIGERSVAGLTCYAVRQGLLKV